MAFAGPGCIGDPELETRTSQEDGCLDHFGCTWVNQHGCLGCSCTRWTRVVSAAERVVDDMAALSENLA